MLHGAEPGAIYSRPRCDHGQCQMSRDAGRGYAQGCGLLRHTDLGMRCGFRRTTLVRMLTRQALHRVAARHRLAIRRGRDKAVRPLQRQKRRRDQGQKCGSANHLRLRLYWYWDAAVKQMGTGV